LRVSELETRFRTDEGVVRAVDGVSFSVRAGETVCLVGESGSGKTVASESITRILRSPPAEIAADSIYFKGRDLAALSDRELRAVRGGEIAHVFQNPQGSLNPVYSVGWQLVEAIQLHSEAGRREARERAVELLDRVGIPEATARFDDYPHEFSGGMKQRVVIAMALAAEPDLLIADEPTTALDVTIQAQILRLLADLQREFDMAVLLITHDLGVVAQVADRVVVLYAGKVMERGSVYDVFESPAHPYTRALLACLPGRGERSQPIGGTLPDPTAPPPGCRFAPRCPHAVDACTGGGQPPEYDADGDGRAPARDGRRRSAASHHTGAGTAGAGVPAAGGADAADDGIDHAVSCVHYGPGGDPTVVERGDGDVDGDGPTGRGIDGGDDQ
jgi:peptide/nickel transport system ATP-binding protein